jgi:hypothetical protein
MQDTVGRLKLIFQSEQRVGCAPTHIAPMRIIEALGPLAARLGSNHRTHGQLNGRANQHFIRRYGLIQAATMPAPIVSCWLPSADISRSFADGVPSLPCLRTTAAGCWPCKPCAQGWHARYTRRYVSSSDHRTARRVMSCADFDVARRPHGAMARADSAML